MKTIGLFGRRRLRHVRDLNKRIRPAAISDETLRAAGPAAVRRMNPAARHPELKPTGKKGAPIYLLLPAPSKDEDLAGRLGVGPAERWLRNVLPPDWAANVRRAVCCGTLPPNDPETKAPRKPLAHEVTCFRQALEEDILAQKPKLIIGCGATALAWAIPEQGNLPLCRGRAFPIRIRDHVCWFVPINAPDHETMPPEGAGFKAQRIAAEIMRMTKRYVRAAYKLVKPGAPDPRESYTSELDVRKRIELLRDEAKIVAALDAMRGVVATDLETSELRPYALNAKLLTLAFSSRDRNIVFPWMHQDFKPPSPTYYTNIRAAIKRLLLRCTIVAHNLAFECEWFRSMFSAKTILRTKWADTMAQAYVLDERQGGLGLDFVAGHRFGLRIKEFADVDRTWLANEPVDNVMFYNGADAKYTLRLYFLQRRLIRKERKLEFVYNLHVERIPPLVEAQRKGVLIDQKHMRRLDRRYGKRLRRFERRIMRTDAVKQYARRFGAFNPSSAPQVKNLLTKVIGLRGVTKVDEKFLKTVKHPIARRLLKHRKIAKARSTYVTPFLRDAEDSYIFPDRRVHTVYNSLKVMGGRLSCAASWTPVVTKRGIVELAKVQIGDLVWTHKNRWRKVTATIYKGIEQMYAVHFCNGQVLTCTGNHKLLVSGDGILENMVQQSRECKSSTSPISETFVPNRRAGSPQVAYTRAKRATCFENQDAARRVQSSPTDTLLEVEDGGEKPNAGQDGGTASEMDRDSGRWIRVFDLLSQWRTCFCPSSGYGRSFGVKEAAEEIHRASHRRESKKQQHTQPRACDQQRPHDGAHDAKTGPRLTRITEIKSVGYLKVFDITVEEDHSYAACGVFSHNSEEPNMQNIPVRTDEGRIIRRGFIPGPGMVILASDYGQIEYRVIGMASRDKSIVDSLWHNYDVHMHWAKRIAKYCPMVWDRYEGDEEDRLKEIRQLAKNKLVFPAFFGSAERSIAGYLELPEDPVSRLMREFWEFFRGVKVYQEDVIRKYNRLGYVETLTGRRRHAPCNMNEIINTPIQGTASDIVVDAWRRCHAYGVERGDLHYSAVLNIHDDLTFVLPAANVDDYKARIGNMMCRPKFDFINVPIAIEFKIGRANWGQMEEYGKMQYPVTK